MIECCIGASVQRLGATHRGHRFRTDVLMRSAPLGSIAILPSQQSNLGVVSEGVACVRSAIVWGTRKGRFQLARKGLVYSASGCGSEQRRLYCIFYLPYEN